ncbi:hypothetical protein [Acetobacter conturbans]|uniref:Type IV secretion system protein VirB2 n=1 Tax=Acetobacter conturbans TaxID=1737472 RepID=A0ABX0K2E7_9PROT|nr:hypothetical protein [Acetobacter conturbans]NHN89864.1 hypothetical protein [Acetobacter conturbans]
MMIQKDETPAPVLARVAAVCAFVALGVLSASPAMAAVSGSVDPSTGLTTLAPYFLGLCEAAIIIICMYKGVHAVGEGRSLGPILIGFVSGTLLCVGGYYGLTHMGVTTSSI